MAHVRMEIRRILDEYGCRNNFCINEPFLSEEEFSEVVIKDWDPDPRAYELKKRIERTVSERVVVTFSPDKPFSV